MEFLAHRGLWDEKSERNSFEALCQGLDQGYGLETDIRDLNGQLVISHDMPLIDTSIPLKQLLRYYSDGGYNSTLALNIKSDGLQGPLKEQLAAHDIDNYFVFDMSVPDTLIYVNFNLSTYIRHSELESHPELTTRTDGIWLDELTLEWINAQTIIDLAKLTQKLCIVSSELHGRDYARQWSCIQEACELGCPSSKLQLCTDVPAEAKWFFK